LALLGIFIGGLITGTFAMSSRAENESVIGSFVGGFIDGAIGTIAIATGLAIGGPIGLVFTGGMSLVGGMAGHAVGQLISYGNINWGTALIQGIISAVFNTFLAFCFSVAELASGSTVIARFIDALKPSTAGIGISTFVAYNSFPSLNINRS